MEYGYSQLTPHRRLAHSAVRLECEGDYSRAAEVWLVVARQAPDMMWQQWARWRAKRCELRAEAKGDAKAVLINK